MPAKYFSIIRNCVLSVSSQRKYHFYHQNTLLDAFRTNSRNIIGRNPSMVIPLLANQDLTPMLYCPASGNNNSRKVKINDQTSDSCVRSIARIIGSLRVWMRTRAIARITRGRLLIIIKEKVEFCAMLYLEK